MGVDEVGRGALAGPLAVGAVVVTRPRSAPEGLDDSKALTEREREALEAPLDGWATAWALGWASAQEIDAWGLRRRSPSRRLGPWRASAPVPTCASWTDR